jgi:hypothetical protein
MLGPNRIRYFFKIFSLFVKVVTYFCYFVNVFAGIKVLTSLDLNAPKPWQLLKPVKGYEVKLIKTSEEKNEGELVLVNPPSLALAYILPNGDLQPFNRAEYHTKDIHTVLDCINIV